MMDTRDQPKVRGMIKFQCECGRKIAAPDQWLGKRVRCPQCGKPVLVQEGTPITPTAILAQGEPAQSFGSGATHEVAGTQGHFPKVDSPEPSAQPSEAPFGMSPETVQPSFVTTSADAPKAIESEADGAKDDEDFSNHEPVVAEATSPKVFATQSPPTVGYGDFTESAGVRVPVILGLLGLITGGVGAALYWVPVLEWYACPAVAAGGVLLAILGIIVSLRRERRGLAVPVLALVVSALAVGVPWLYPLVQNALAQPAPTVAVAPRDWTSEKKNDDSEPMRRMVMAVQSVQLVGGKDSPIGDVEYKLTNKGSKPIKSITGSIQLFDREHKQLGSFALEVPFNDKPLDPGASIGGKSTWPMDAHVEQVLADGQATGEYRAESVVYSDGSQENFDR